MEKRNIYYMADCRLWKDEHRTFLTVMHLKSTVKTGARVAQALWPERQKRVLWGTATHRLCRQRSLPFLPHPLPPHPLPHPHPAAWPSQMPASCPAPATEGQAGARRGTGGSGSASPPCRHLQLLAAARGCQAGPTPLPKFPLIEMVKASN